MQIVKAVRIPTGSIFPILARLVRTGWATSTWEDVDPAVIQRPRRRDDQLTDRTTRHASRVAAKAATSWAPRRRPPPPNPGEVPR